MSENPGKTRWINVVLFFSLALNFFIAGYLVSDTKIFKNIHVKKVYYKRPEIRIVDYFPKNQRKEFRRLMVEKRIKLMPVQRGIFESQKDFFKVISEKQVDETRLRKTFQKYQNSNDQLHTTINDIVVELVLKMDHKTRLSIIKRGKKAHERRKKITERWRSENRHLKERIHPLPEHED